MTLTERDLAPAVALGHTLEWDMPWASTGDRHTCTQCGRAVLGSDTGVVYGSALTEPCRKAIP